jgi:hypothetical protein
MKNALDTNAKKLRLLRLDAYYFCESEDLAEALRALADRISTPPFDAPGISSGVSHHSAIHNYGIGRDLTGNLAIFDFDPERGWIELTRW